MLAEMISCLMIFVLFPHIVMVAVPVMWLVAEEMKSLKLLEVMYSHVVNLSSRNAEGSEVYHRVIYPWLPFCRLCSMLDRFMQTDFLKSELYLCISYADIGPVITGHLIRVFSQTYLSFVLFHY